MNATLGADERFREQIAGIYADVPGARHLPPEIYCSPDVAEREKSKIFMRQWLSVAREEELPNAGDYLTLRIAGEPVVIARENGGSIVAYMNACLHRGVQVAFDKGNAERFHCPYHAWTYDIAGNLIGAPRMKDSGHDLEGQRLPRIRTALWRGWVFINFDESAPSFEQFIEPYEENAWWYRSGDCRLAHKVVFDVQCNWKFIVENLVDYYHASTVHAGTFGTFYRLGTKSLPGKLLPGGGSLVEFGESIRTYDTNLPFPRLPWMAEGHVVQAKGAMFPNVNFSAADSLRVWHIWPDGPQRTQLIGYILLPPASFNIPDYESKLKGYVDYVGRIVSEDRLALESLQSAVNSSRFNPGLLSNLEGYLQHLLKHYVDVMDFGGNASSSAV